VKENYKGILQILEETMEPPLNLVVYGAFEDKVLLELNLPQMVTIENPLSLQDVVVHFDLWMMRANM